MTIQTDDIKLGMSVYDSTENGMGEVAFVSSPNTQVNDDELPDDASGGERQNLQEKGFIRIENSLFSGAAFADLTQIDRVEGDDVYLSVKQNEVIRTL